MYVCVHVCMHVRVCVRARVVVSRACGCLCVVFACAREGVRIYRSVGVYICEYFILSNVMRVFVKFFTKRQDSLDQHKFPLNPFPVSFPSSLPIPDTFSLLSLAVLTCTPNTHHTNAHRTHARCLPHFPTTKLCLWSHWQVQCVFAVC